MFRSMSMNSYASHHFLDGVLAFVLCTFCEATLASRGGIFLLFRLLHVDPWSKEFV
jgi:hypothetical protein